MQASPVHPLGHDARLIGTVSVAHFLSHFFQLALPALFPLLREAFDTSYAALGTLMGVFYLVSGASQFASGFVVDRIGARPTLISGIGLMAGGTLLAGFAQGVGWLYPAIVLMGVGNGVFHPANFAILNASVTPSRLGYAFSMHGIGGNLGYAAAPVASYALGVALGWRPAVAIMGAVGLAVCLLVALQPAAHYGRRHEGGGAASLRGSLHLFRQPPVLLCFAFFCILTLATVSLQTFLPTMLNKAFDVPIAVATSAATLYFLGGTAGILLGGVLASNFPHHQRVAATGLGIAAMLMAAVVMQPAGTGVLLPMLAMAGLAIGSTGPSRDLIVRAATPAGASGRVYGFVYSGLDLGSTAGPVIIGFLLDHGAARAAFGVIAALMVVAIGTVVGARRAAVAA